MGRMRRGLVIAAVGAAVLSGSGLVGPPVEAQVPAGDSVTGSGTVEFTMVGLPGSVVTPFGIDVQSGPSGENPTGRVSFSALGIDAPITCLDVRTVGTSPPFNQATMNVETSQFGLVTMQVSDGDPEGLPDLIRSLTFSSRSSSDCSPLPFGAENVQGTVLTGDIAMVDAPPLPTTKEQCKDGSWARFGFKNQGECIAFVERRSS